MLNLMHCIVDTCLPKCHHHGVYTYCLPNELLHGHSFAAETNPALTGLFSIYALTHQ